MLILFATQQTSEVINSAQQALDMSAEISTNNCKFSSPLAPQTREQDQSQSSVFSNKEPFNTIQEQSLAPSGSFHVPNKSLLHQGVQPFLLEHRESLGQERTSNSGSSVVGLSQIDDNSQQQLSLLPPDEVAQLEQAVRQLQAKGFCNIHLQSENTLSKQRHHQLQQQQQQIQHQQQQIQHQQQHIQQQQQHIQQQEQQIHLQQQQHQQQQALENLQHQLFQPQVQIHCSSEQQSSSQGMVQNGSPLFQQTPSQQQQQQQQQQASLYQQATGFLQQQPSHSSPSLFHNPTAMTEVQSPQEALFHTQKTSPNQDQVQASLFQSNLTVLCGSNMSAEAQPSATSMFLSQNAVPGQLAVNTSQPQQLVFLTSMQTSSLEAPSVFQTPPQLSPIQQGTPMEQQQSPQHAQPGSMFQSISQSPSKLPPSQQQQQASLLLGSLSSPVTQEQTSNLLFGGQIQIGSMNNSNLASPEQQNTSLPFSQAGMVTVRQQESSELMTFQDQTTMVVNPSSNKPIFQDQQPMQLAPNSGTAPSQSVNLYMDQSSMQGGMASQEPLFAPQSDVTRIQTSTSSPVQQPGQLFQTTMSGSLNQPNQNQQQDLFLFNIQNG